MMMNLVIILSIMSMLHLLTLNREKVVTAPIFFLVRPLGPDVDRLSLKSH